MKLLAILGIITLAIVAVNAADTLCLFCPTMMTLFEMLFKANPDLADQMENGVVPFCESCNLTQALTQSCIEIFQGRLPDLLGILVNQTEPKKACNLLMGCHYNV